MSAAKVSKPLNDSKQKISTANNGNITSENNKSGNNINNNLEETNPISDALSKDDVQTKIMKKCFRQGSRICYTDLENITLLKKIPERKTSKIHEGGEDEAFEKVDSYRSGESLFKTFTFEQTRDIDDPETAKCIEFWKSVMKKNLAPIKCTLMECDNRCTICPKKEKKASSVILDQKEETQKKSSIKSDEIKSNLAAGAKIWTDALKEIRRRKLNQLKVYIKERCDYCKDPFKKDLVEGLGVETEKEKLEKIESLNTWKPDTTSPKTEGRASRSFSGKLNKTSKGKVIDPKSKTDKHSSLIVTQNNRKSEQKQNVKPTAPSNDILTENRTKGSTEKHRDSSNSNKQIQKGDIIAGPPQVVSVEVQEPRIKCTCESNVCAHKTALRNSITSFVRSARENMQKDSSDTQLVHDETSCICGRAQDPWSTCTCSTDPCPSKTRKLDVQESSSDFDLTEQQMDRRCVCIYDNEIECKVDVCGNKISQGSLHEGFPKDLNEEICTLCEESKTMVPCLNRICPLKMSQEKNTKCICGKTVPWSSSVCESSTCRYQFNEHLKKFRRQESEPFQDNLYIADKDSTTECECRNKTDWNTVECSCPTCKTKSNLIPSLKTEERKMSKRRETEKSKSADILEMKRLSINLDKNVVNEKVPSYPKIELPSEKAKCKCAEPPPWIGVTCLSPYCKNDVVTRIQTVSEKSVASDHIITHECVCEDKGLDTICKSHKCQHRSVSVTYPLPCLCPEDENDTDPQHVQCASDTCKRRKSDKPCICKAELGIICESPTCQTEPKGSNLLKPEKKQLRYNSACICKVRGEANIEEITCSVPECPLRKKLRKSTKTNQRPYLAMPYEGISATEPEHQKCICSQSNKDVPTICGNIKCRKQNESLRSNRLSQNVFEDDEEEPEVCICDNNNLANKEHEIICKHIQCPKVSVNEGGVVMADKCTCVNLDATCGEPVCPSNQKRKPNQDVGQTVQEERPYCYICGNYDCAGARRKSNRTTICSSGKKTNT